MNWITNHGGIAAIGDSNALFRLALADAGRQPENDQHLWSLPWKTGRAETGARTDERGCGWRSPLPIRPRAVPRTWLQLCRNIWLNSATIAVAPAQSRKHKLCKHGDRLGRSLKGMSLE
jgi:hypothetical protein